MLIEESRRLTGPNLFTHLPGAICDIEAAVSEHAALGQAWRSHARTLLDALGWQDSVCFERSHATGISLMLTAPIDCLYAATDLNEAAFAMAEAELSGGVLPAFDVTVQHLQTLIAEEQSAALVRLSSMAAEKEVPFLSDDDEVSIGFGERASVWPADQLPATDTIDWQTAGHHGDTPVALITGTNGKSTTVRLAASIIAAGDRTAGVTSTDYIRVGDEVIDTGDYSGPGGARQLLRHPKTDVALLEVARGGMLRRGLGVTQADVALITNVAADHLGEYGIHTVAELRDAKFIVRRGLAPNKPLILNADDPGVVAYASDLTGQVIVWFSESPDNPTVQSHVATGGHAFVVADGQLTFHDRSGDTAIVPINDVPVTLAGSARHNVQNAVAAAALCYELGCDFLAIKKGLIEFGGGPDENPGRGNFFEGKGVKAVVDFAHNEHGLSAMAKTIANMPAKRRLVLMGQAGDRSDALIDGLTKAALQAQPDQLVVCQLPGYERGRPPEEVPQLIAQIAMDAGVDAAAIHHARDPASGTRFALEWARPGDLLLILALTQRDESIRLIQSALHADA